MPGEPLENGKRELQVEGKGLLLEIEGEHAIPVQDRRTSRIVEDILGTVPGVTFQGLGEARRDLVPCLAAAPLALDRALGLVQQVLLIPDFPGVSGPSGREIHIREVPAPGLADLGVPGILLGPVGPKGWMPLHGSAHQGIPVPIRVEYLELAGQLHLAVSPYAHLLQEPEFLRSIQALGFQKSHLGPALLHFSLLSVRWDGGTHVHSGLGQLLILQSSIELPLSHLHPVPGPESRQVLGRHRGLQLEFGSPDSGSGGLLGSPGTGQVEKGAPAEVVGQVQCVAGIVVVRNIQSQVRRGEDPEGGGTGSQVLATDLGGEVGEETPPLR